MHALAIVMLLCDSHGVTHLTRERPSPGLTDSGKELTEPTGPEAAARSLDAIELG